VCSKLKNQVHSIPKVTIGLCVRNSENLIKEAIKSVIGQDYPHEFMEVIFVDDGSEDGTLSVIESYVQKMDMSTKVFHQEWKGLGPARNVIVNNADGKYILWVDGDMMLSMDFVRKQVMFMEKNPKVGIGKGRYGMYVQANLLETLENMEFMATNFRRRGKVQPIPLGTGGSIYRVEAIRQVDGFDQNITGSGEDYDAEYRVRAAGWFLEEITSAVFYERRRKTWNSLWNEYFWHGRSGPYLLGKSKQMFNPYKLWPPVTFTIELSRISKAYKLTGKKAALLLPIHYVFKRTAWILGFLRDLLKNDINKRKSTTGNV
jgi:glycosyltransferase involved in cell wall biosynthesis